MTVTVRFTQFIWRAFNSAKQLPTLRISQSMSQPAGCYHLQPRLPSEQWTHTTNSILIHTLASFRQGLCWHIPADISEMFSSAAALVDQCSTVNTAPCTSCNTQTGRHSSAVCCCPPHQSDVPLACVAQSLQQNDPADHSNSCTAKHL